MTPNKVVARYQDGRVLKGLTFDFAPNRQAFHLNPVGASSGDKPILVNLNELKAIFFVKDFIGDSQHDDRKEFDPSRRPAGRKVTVQFKDGEVLLGTTQAYDRNRPGFFLIPADPQSNIDRCYVVQAAAIDISFV
jgi:hypothetical protein